MATWHDFCDLAGTFGGEQVSETGWVFSLQGWEEGRFQKVFVFHEVMQPDFGFIHIKSGFAMIDLVDLEQIVKAFGQMQVGAIGYSPRFDEDGNPIQGILNLTTSIPLSVLDLSEPIPFFLYLNIFAQAADNIELKIDALGLGDIF